MRTALDNQYDWEQQHLSWNLRILQRNEQSHMVILSTRLNELQEINRFLRIPRRQNPRSLRSKIEDLSGNIRRFT
ncbi:uncharacterized protein OCT59_024573 [Rhizophagus irregularis]|uniref:uncharacterized protein n=1 Tax=Rhizophagus irregularis TaxID=588596 RepID=UPI00332D827A|nr:hypothetical protein OCT59_024573 [Rhizophagus irregularis]